MGKPANVSFISTYDKSILDGVRFNVPPHKL